MFKVRGNLPQSLNISISDSTTWPQAHSLLTNCFNNAAPVDTKCIYQFTNIDTREEINSFEKGKGKGRKAKGPQKVKGSKGSSSGFRCQKVSQKVKARPSQRERISGPFGHGIKVQSWNQNQGDQKGKFFCQVCGQTGHQAYQC